MKAIKINETWKLYPTLPKVWNNKQPYNEIEEGFKDVIRPTMASTQKLGGLVYDDVNDVLTYEVIDKTESEIFEDELNNATEVSAIKFLAQLEREGVTEEAILNIIASLPSPDNIDARIAFKRATTFERDNALLLLVGQAYGFDDAKLNGIFVNASKLNLYEK